MQSSEFLSVEACHRILNSIERGGSEELAGGIADLLYLGLQTVVIAEKNEGVFDSREVFRKASMGERLFRYSSVLSSGHSGTAGQENDMLLRNNIPNCLPNLLRARVLQEEVDRARLPQPDSKEAWMIADSILNSLNPNSARINQTDARENFGELLLNLTSLARALHVDLEDALSKANEELEDRILLVEEHLRRDGRTAFDASDEELRDRWSAAASEKNAAS